MVDSGDCNFGVPYFHVISGIRTSVLWILLLRAHLYYSVMGSRIGPLQISTSSPALLCGICSCPVTPSCDGPLIIPSTWNCCFRIQLPETILRVPLLAAHLCCRPTTASRDGRLQNTAASQPILLSRDSVPRRPSQDSYFQQTVPAPLWSPFFVTHLCYCLMGVPYFHLTSAIIQRHSFAFPQAISAQAIFHSPKPRRSC